MIKLTMDNVYLKIENIPQGIEMVIWNRLSFEIEEFGQQYNRVRHLYNRKTKKTYAGLLPNLIEILEELDEEYEIVDKRKKHKPNADFKLVDKITLPDGSEQYLQLRPYQKEVVDRCTERETIQSATGSGKTVMMAALIAKYNVKPIGVFADKMSLCFQIKEEFEKFLGIPIGLVGGGINKKEDITIFSIQSTTKEDVKDMKMIMFDECVTYNTLVLMADGTYEKIGKLVDEKSNREIMSFNHQTGMIEPKIITNHSRTSLDSHNKKLMRITIKQEDGSLNVLECTNNHKIWIESENKYIRADEIVKGMEVIIKKEK